MIFGWVNVNLHCFIVGHTGFMLILNARILATPLIGSLLSSQSKQSMVCKISCHSGMFPKHDAGEPHNPEEHAYYASNYPLQMRHNRLYL